MRNDKFDLFDLVNDLYHRLKEESYKGDEFHFVTMSQVALLKHVCRNIEEGFIFRMTQCKQLLRN